MNRHLLLLALTSLLIWCTAGASAADLFAQRYDLRVYGSVTAQELPTIAKYGTYRHIRLTAENHDKAVIVCSKFLSDFTTLPTARITQVTAGGASLDALLLTTGQVVLPVLKANTSDVDIYCFTTEKDCNTFLQRASKDVAGAGSYSQRRHPFFMDFWDRHCMGFWYRLQQNSKDQTDASDMEFLKKYGLMINGVHSMETIATRARKEGLGYKINRWYDVGNWAYEAYPEAANAADPDMTMQGDYYGEVPFAESPIERAQNAAMLDYLKQFTDDEHFLSITDPHGETGPFEDSFAGSRDRNEYSRRDFVLYLRDIRKLSLDDLSRRWYGVPGKFASWNDVEFPRERNFYGWKDGVSQDLAGTWKTRIVDRATGEKEQFFASGYDDTRWFSYEQPGAEFLASGDRNGLKRGGWTRATFTVNDALLKAKGPLYLTVCPFNFAPYADPSTVYLNGQKLGDMTFGYGQEWGQFDVRNIVKPGINVLTAYTVRGCIQGPTFLTQNKAELFPTSDPGLNAQHYDLLEWVAESCARANARYIEYVRGIDPHRPVKLMAFYSMIDYMMPYLERLGGYPHCTGEGAYYRPWLKRYGYLRGIADSSEPSGPADTLLGLKNIFFTMTTEGMNAHDYFWDLQNILDKPDQKAYYEKNVRYFQLMGRYDLKKPEIALARSMRVGRQLPNASEYMNDPGRGDIQQAHQTYVFCAENDLREGLVDNYKVIFDCNYQALEPEDVAALEKYVRQGGTLVANQITGRHTYLKRNAWPINALTGCTATIRPEEGTLTFEKNPPILKAYAGQTFENKGGSVDYQNRDYYTDSIALTPVANDVQVIARYQDGMPAIVMRPLGKGKVIVLGSAFYRNARDISGYFVGSPEQTKFYKALFGDLGVQPTIGSDNDWLWGERFISNNGTSELLVLGNKDTKNRLENGVATWTLDFTPRRVFDPVTGENLPVKINGKVVTISNINLDPLDMAYYAVERPDRDGMGMVQHWLFRQSQLWKAVPAGRETPKLDPTWPILLVGNYDVKQFDTEADARKALAVDYQTDATWKSMPQSNWESAGLKMGPNLWGVYRKTFTIDPAWLNNLRRVETIWNNWPLSSSHEIYVNGVMVIDNNKPVNQEQILGVLKPGANLFTLICKSRPDGDGGFMANFSLRGIPGANGEQMDISKGWTIYTSDIDSYRTDFPAKATYMLARKSLLIPSKFRNYSIWIEVQSNDPNNVTSVATNGRLRYIGPKHGSAYWQGAFLMNITPDIKFGEENDIIIGAGSDFKSALKTRTGTFEYAKLIIVPKD